MAVADDIASVPRFQQFVLLCVADLGGAGETPIHSFDVKDACARHIDGVDGGLFGGGAGRREVVGALTELHEAGLLDEETDTDDSPVGKGRPTYALAVDRAAVLDVLADDDYLGPVVERVRDNQ